jgi:zinc protease
MRKALFLALLAGCSTVKVVSRQGIQMSPVEFPLRSLTYPSGLRVLVERDTRTQLAGVFLVVGAGSTSDPAGKEGLAHYIEHLAFRSRPTGNESVWNLLERAGAVSFNAFTGFDETVYYEIGLASNLPELLRLEGARMLTPVAGVSDDERKTELEVVRNELRQRNETGFIGGVLGDLQAAVFPPDHPYSRAVVGTHQSLSAVGSADVQAYVKTNYRPDNMTVLILGNVDLATADKLVERAMPHQLFEAEVKVRVGRRMPDAPPAVPQSPPQGREIPRREAAVAAPELWLAWSLRRAFDTEAYLAGFVRRAAVQRLSSIIQDDKDVASVNLQIYPGVQASMLFCRVELHTAAHPEETRDRLLKEVSNILDVQDPLAELQFAQARRVAIIGEMLQAQDLANRGLQRATATHFSQDPRLYSRSVRDLIAMRQIQVRDYAAPYLTKERARALLFLPLAGTRQARDLLEQPAPDASSFAAVEPHASSPAGWERERLRELLADPAERFTYSLQSGLSVILERRPGLPLVSAGMLFPTIARDAGEDAAAIVVQLVGNAGRMLNGSPDQFGALFSRESDKDHLAYYLEGASGNTEAIIATLAEYVRELGVDRFGWVAVETYFTPWLQRSEKDPRSAADRQFLEALLPGSPFGRTVGSQAMHDSSQSVAQAFIRRTHTPAHATLALVGDFEVAAATKMITESFGNWKAEAPEEAAPAPPQASVSSGAVKLLVSNRPGATQAELQFGCLLPEAKEGPVLARHEVSARVLEDRLWKVLRQKMGATYGIYAGASTRRGGTAYLDAGGAIETGKLGAVLGNFKAVLAALGAEPPTADEIAWAKVRRANGRASANMTNRGIAAAALRSARLGFAISGEDLGTVTAEDVRADFQYCLRGNPTLSIVGAEPVVRSAFKDAWR